MWMYSVKDIMTCAFFPYCPGLIVVLTIVIYTSIIFECVDVTATRWPGPPFQLLSVAKPISRDFHTDERH